MSGRRQHSPGDLALAPAVSGGSRSTLAAGLLGLAVVITSAFMHAPSATGQTITLTERVGKLPIRGVVRSLRQATISTELAAIIAKVGFREGERFAKGDVLVAFDCRRHRAELASAEAVHQEMKIAVESNAFLEKRNAASRQDVEIAKARAAKAAAEAEALRVRLDQCNIIAPFDGRVAELAINEHEMSAAGKAMLSIIEEGELEIDLILPSDWLVWLRTGAEFAFAIDETQQAYPASIIRIGATVDSISQTIKVTGRFTAARAGVLPGMSGSARFQTPGG